MEPRHVSAVGCWMTRQRQTSIVCLRPESRVHRYQTPWQRQAHQSKQKLRECDCEIKTQLNVWTVDGLIVASDSGVDKPCHCGMLILD